MAALRVRQLLHIDEVLVDVVRVHARLAVAEEGERLLVRAQRGQRGAEEGAHLELVVVFRHRLQAAHRPAHQHQVHGFHLHRFEDKVKDVLYLINGINFLLHHQIPFLFRSSLGKCFTSCVRNRIHHFYTFAHFATGQAPCLAFRQDPRRTRPQGTNCGFFLVGIPLDSEPVPFIIRSCPRHLKCNIPYRGKPALISVVFSRISIDLGRKRDSNRFF
mmetsp:Transcript_26762/g.50619  ORF Transcript_26762/g.50619 Transcript_26762/m.50619 type:complete len:217 (-) Transcript_26762:103-753(-)